VITTAGEGDVQRPGRLETSSSSFRTGPRHGDRSVGWDVFDDVGVLRVDPKSAPT
jgi:hypothetical protein